MQDWWLKTYREVGPSENQRMNTLVVDINFDPDYQIVDAKTAAVEAVHKIASEHPGPYSLMASGGIDSQTMILAWKMSNIPFNVVHYSYMGLNAHDTETLSKFCQLHEVPFTTLIFDALTFITSPQLVEYAKKYDCSSPQILTYIAMIADHPETVIMAGNFINFEHCGLNYTILALERFAREKKNFVPFFLMSTKDLAYAFYHTELTERIEQLKRGDQLNDYTTKCHAYQSLGFSVVSQGGKFTGFEKIKASFDSQTISGKIKLKHGSYNSKRPFDFLYRYSLYDSIGTYSERTIYLAKPSNHK